MNTRAVGAKLVTVVVSHRCSCWIQDSTFRSKMQEVFWKKFWKSNKNLIFCHNAQNWQNILGKTDKTSSPSAGNIRKNTWVGKESAKPADGFFTTETGCVKMNTSMLKCGTAACKDGRRGAGPFCARPGKRNVRNSMERTITKEKIRFGGREPLFTQKELLLLC